jgi:hypothetical protein
MRTQTYNALIEHLWKITDTDKSIFCNTDIKIHTTKYMIKDYKTIKYSVIKNNKFIKHTYLIKLDDIKKIEMTYTRNKKLDEILN